jgi:precorrin-4 methylase
MLSSKSVPAADTKDLILRIGGLVRSPIHLTLSDLQQFREKKISAYPDMESKGSRTQRYRAVPLSNLLELAKVQVPIQELAVSLKSNHGEQIVLSGGEIFLNVQNRIFVAESSIGGDKPRDNLPALIIGNNHRFSIFLSQITFIEVISIAQSKSDLINSKKMALPEDALVKANSVQGYRLRSALDQMTLKLEPTDILKIAARDGNAVATSLQELKSYATPIIMSRKDKNNYDLIFPGDSGKERRLEDIDSIEIMSLKQKPMMYVVGVGCGDTSLLTNEAISIMGKADVFVSKDDYQKTFAGYIAGKPVLFDPFMQLARYQKSKHPEFTDAEAEKTANSVYADNIQMLRKTLTEGKIIALLEPGDPSLYGGWRNWLSGYIPQDQIKIIAGMSSFSAANAVLGEYDISKNPIIIAEPEQLKANEQLIQSAAEKGNVLVLFMGLNRMKSLVPLLENYFPPETPFSVVYYAGIAGKEHKIQTSLAKAIETTDAEKKNFLGLIYVGRDLKHSEAAK